MTRLASATALTMSLLAFGLAASAQEAVPVVAVIPRSSTVAEELKLTGTLTAERSTRLSTRVDGLVARVHADAGDTVRAGEPLVELDSEMARLALRRAEAAVREAQARLTEAERLLAEAVRLAADKHIPQTEVDTRRAQTELAKASLAAVEAARLEQAELVRRHVLPAPFDGTVTRKLTEVGEWVSRGTPVMEFVATDRVRLDVRAPQERFAQISDESPVTVRPDALPGESLRGRIVARVPVSDASARTFLVRILIDDPNNRLLPGTSATALIGLSGGKDSTLIVPRDALLKHPDGGTSLFVLEDTDEGTIARRRVVKLGRSVSDGVEILSGLNARERVVTRGNEALRDGQRVRVIAAD